MPTFTPTPEQVEIVDAFARGGNLVISAGAGTGKTSTLLLIALAAQERQRRGVYAAFNRSVADEAARKFSPNVLCKTLHSLAYREEVGPIGRERLNAPRQNGLAAARILGVTMKEKITDEVWLGPHQIAAIAVETVEHFCNSDAIEPERWHVPARNGLESPEARLALADLVLPVARKAWRDLSSRQGKLRWSHSTYLKRWALRGPNLGADFVCLDEAQDSNSVTMGVVRAQAARGAQIVAVGDSNQAIYGWRGATDAMDAFGGTRLQLSQSFRFGPAIAAQANLWLDGLDSTMRLRGTDSIDSRTAALETADAILTRTNAEAVARVMAHQGAGVPVALVGGGKAMESLAKAAQQLQQTGSTWHPDLMAFTSWGQVQEYVDQEESGSDLKVFVKLIDAHGPETVIRAMGNLAPFQ